MLGRGSDAEATLLAEVLRTGRAYLDGLDSAERDRLKDAFAGALEAAENAMSPPCPRVPSL